jgi:hypothetical protein
MEALGSPDRSFGRSPVEEQTIATQHRKDRKHHAPIDVHQA